MRDSNSIAGITQEELDELFFGVLELSKETRTDWLAKHCQGNSGLIKEIQSLVDAHEQSGEFLNDSQVPRLQDPIQLDYSGQRFGVWQLQSIIGRGGMGTVYKAHRCDGRYDQTVAVKVGPAYGLRSELFNREVQVLANLNHAVITKIVDAGEVPDSQDAYLVMEFVDGKNILSYVHSTKNLATADKAKLFVILLEALHQAHCQGVIHCDIKPDNILVDDVGGIKLLDFGISRSVEESADDALGVEVGALTKGFASPQRLAGQHPTVGDDVYGVGLLFGLIMFRGSLSEINNGKDANESIDVLAQCLTPEAKAIFLKATNNDPQKRYTSAYAFMEDITRWTNHQPIEAFNGGAVYRLKKLYKRHRFSSVASVLMVSVLGVSGFAWHTHEQSLKVQESQEAQVLAALKLSREISSTLDLRVSHLPGSLPVRIATAELALAQIKEIHAQQPDNSEIKVTLAEAYLQLQGLYFQPSQLHIGAMQKGREGLRTAYELAYDAYKLDGSLKNLMVLVRATRRITANLMIVEKDWNSAQPYEQELIDEFNTFDVKDAVSKAAHRPQQYVMFRIHMLNNDLDAARTVLDKAVALSNVSKENLSTFALERFGRHEKRLLELTAVYSMITGDFDSAQSQFEFLAEDSKDKSLWLHRRRGVYAHRSMACIDLLRDKPNYRSAERHFSQAYEIALSLTKEFPNASALQWELLELDDRSKLAVAVQSTPGTVLQSVHNNIMRTYSCDAPAWIHMPAPPPGGYDSLRTASDISMLSILKPL